MEALHPVQRLSQPPGRPRLVHRVVVTVLAVVMIAGHVVVIVPAEAAIALRAVVIVRRSLVIAGPGAEIVRRVETTAVLVVMREVLVAMIAVRVATIAGLGKESADRAVTTEVRAATIAVLVAMTGAPGSVIGHPVVMTGGLEVPVIDSVVTTGRPWSERQNPRSGESFRFVTGLSARAERSLSSARRSRRPGDGLMEADCPQTRSRSPSVCPCASQKTAMR